MKRTQQLTEETHRIQAKADAAEGHRHQIAAKEKQDLQNQLETLRTQHAAERERNKNTEHGLQTQLKHSQKQLEATLEKNSQIVVANQLEKHEYQTQHNLHAATEEHTRQILTDTQTKCTELQNKYDLLHNQHTVTMEENRQIAAIVQQEKREFQRRREHLQDDRRHRKEIVAIARQRLTKFRSSISEFRHQISAQLQASQQHAESYTSQLNQLATATQKLATSDRVKELAKLEAFDLWVQRSPEMEERILAQTLLHKVTSKLNHTLTNLKEELYQAIQERDDLQNQIEQQQEEDLLQWEKLLGEDKIEDPENSITAIMKYLPPPISIFQYYKAYKPLILQSSSLPNIKNGTEISEEFFKCCG